MKVAITGASGFLGTNLINHFASLGHRIVGIKRKTSDINKIKQNLDKIVFYDSDDGMKNFFDLHSDIEAIIHTATSFGNNGETLTEILNSNVIFPLTIIEHIPKDKKIPFINTDSYFSKMSNHYDYLPNYIQTKRIFSNLASRHCAEINNTFINMQLEHLYGIGDSIKKFVSGTISKLIKNEANIDFTLGEQQRDFIYIDDAVSAYLAIVQSQELMNSEEIINIEVGSGETVSIKDFVLKSKEVTMSKSILNFGSLAYRKDELMISVANTAELKKIGWNCKVSLEEGISKLAASLK